MDMRMASRMAVPPRESIRASASSIFLMSLVKSGSRRKASSLKLTMKTSSCGFDALTSASAAASTFCALVAHAAAVVDDEAQRNRHVLAPEDLDLLLDAVLEDLEGVLRQVGDQVAALVHHAWRAAPPGACRRGRRPDPRPAARATATNAARSAAQRAEEIVIEMAHSSPAARTPAAEAGPRGCTSFTWTRRYFPSRS